MNLAKKPQQGSGLNMTVEEITLLFNYLNSGMIILIVNLALRRFGLEITLGEYKKNPWGSLILGLSLICISSLLGSILQQQLSGMQPPSLFIFLLLGVYPFVVYVKRRKKKKR